MATDMCLTVAKFSHATGLRADKSIPWTHITAENIFVLVKGDAVNKPHGALTIRVVHGTSTLESIDIGKLIDEAISVRVQDRPPFLLENLPVFGLTKDTAFAIRYLLPDRRPRRVQLRMHSISDCRQVFEALRQRGLEVQDQRPDTSHSGVSHLRPASGQSRSQLLSTQPSSVKFDNLEALHNSRSVSDTFFDAGRFSEQTYTSQAPRYVDQVGLSEHVMAPAKQLSRDESIAPRIPWDAGPSNHQMFSQSNAFDRPVQFAPVSFPGRVSSNINPSLDDPLRRTLPVQEDQAFRQSSTGLQSYHPTLFSSQTISSRPRTSLSMTSAPNRLSQTLEHDIPPRRELPFKRPDSYQSDAHRSMSRPSSSVLSMRPLQRPKLAPTPVAPAPETASILTKKSHALENNETSSTVTRRSARISEKKRANGATPRSAGPVRSRGKADQRVKRAVPMNELLYGAEQSKGVSQNAALHATVPKENVPPIIDNRPSQAVTEHLATSSTPAAPTAPAAAAAPPPPPPPPPLVPAAQSSEALERMHRALLESAKSADASSLEAFAQQSPEDRRAALDAFIIDKLQDPSFATLCEDVENCWRRIGFG